jgi:hypothetical protein
MEQLDAPQAANGGVGPEVLPSDRDTNKQYVALTAKYDLCRPY